MQFIRDHFVNPGIREYAKATGKTMDEALADYHIFSIARDEQAARRAKYIREVPLNDIANGEREKIILTLLRGQFSTVQEAEAAGKAARTALDKIVDNKENHDPLGHRAFDED